MGATLLVTLLIATKVCNARDIPDREIRQDAKEPGEMTNALNYLAELDKYYSNAARPRQRRVQQNLSSALERLSAIKNYYSEMGRSRFGKRSSPAMMGSRNPYDIYLPAAYD